MINDLDWCTESDDFVRICMIGWCLCTPASSATNRLSEANGSLAECHRLKLGLFLHDHQLGELILCRNPGL